ncbi:unnamed protein product [Nesidiocoris tenuis]|uniref:RNA-directed DNA polymerase n=1 Tax=Nesidiocoris tenuis TaxID=355587 RepID=A0A6H5GF53_9HEMI|nr:unnamed protein product [Nesidiocoris tenuis]
MDSAAAIRDTSSCLFVTDRLSKRRFLIDTGSDVCVIPPSFEDKRAGPHRRSLYSVDNSPINTYGERILTLDLGLGRSFRSVFLVANVSHPIIGADFLRFFNLLVDLRERKIVDAETRLATQPLQLGPSAASVQSVLAINQTDEYASLLLNFLQDRLRPVFTTLPKHKGRSMLEAALKLGPRKSSSLVQNSGTAPAIWSSSPSTAQSSISRTLTIFTDHKPLVHAFSQGPEKASPRQFRHLELIAQTDVRHVAGEDNQVADYLSRLENEPSRVEAIVKSNFSPADIARAQQSDTQLKELLDSGSSSVQLKKLAFDDSSLYCDISTSQIRPFVPTPLRSLIFRHFHGISHAGGRESSGLISSRFVWPSMHRDIKRWVRECILCQKSKIQRHGKTPLVHFLQLTN